MSPSAVSSVVSYVLVQEVRRVTGHRRHFSKWSEKIINKSIDFFRIWVSGLVAEPNSFY